MKVLALVGSYRRNGNTDQMIHLIQQHMESIAEGIGEPYEFEIIYLGHQQIQPCRGCRICFDRGEEKCPNKDDLLAVKAKMHEADGLLVASPVYVDDVSGITKNWIDRLAHACHRPEFAGKSAYLLATVGSSPTEHALRTLSLALSTWGIHIVGKAGWKSGALMNPEEMKAQFNERAEKIAQRFFKALHKKEYRRPSFFSLMMFRIQQIGWKKHGIPDTIDYQYWKSQGWFESRCQFYFEHRASPIKVALARLTGMLIARFVS
jgi:multimeric flavodoxin WrbA